MPHNSTFLLSKFLMLRKELNVGLLAWDHSKDLKKIPLLTNEIRSAIALGLPGTSAVDAFNHTALAFISFLSHPVLFSRFFFFLLRTTGSLRKTIVMVLKFHPFVSLRAKLVHFEFGTLGRDIIFLKDFFKFRVIVSFRGYDLNYAGLQNPSYYEPVWSKADGIHFLGKDLQSRAHRRGYQGNLREALISPAVDLKKFRRLKPYLKEATPFVVVSVGRLAWKKGLEYGIRAIKELVDQGLNLEYRIIGDGEFMQAISFTMFELKMEGAVKLLGSRSSDEIIVELEGAHVFLHPAISEGFCNAVIEAQAMELPVVCSDADGLAENIDDGVTGFVVAKWDVNAMAEKVKRLYHDRDLGMTMGKKGRLRAEKLYSLDDQIARFKSFYMDILVHEN